MNHRFKHSPAMSVVAVSAMMARGVTIMLIKHSFRFFFDLKSIW
ncbi:hypothetical protein AC90_4757 [Escherichia coli 3-475-03_S4_C1]|nr:hypothetical protein AC90_4757 [Escherichia coli 3-475-03_S4_C1]